MHRRAGRRGLGGFDFGNVRARRKCSGSKFSGGLAVFGSNLSRQDIPDKLKNDVERDATELFVQISNDPDVLYSLGRDSRYEEKS